MGEPPGQPRLVSHESHTPGWPGSVEDPRPSGCFAKRSAGGSIELLGGAVVFAPSIRGLYTSFGCSSEPQEPNHGEASQGKGYDGARNKSELTEGQP